MMMPNTFSGRHFFCCSVVMINCSADGIVIMMEEHLSWGDWSSHFSCPETSLKLPAVLNDLVSWRNTGTGRRSGRQPGPTPSNK
jgi:hypothetical protein